MASVSSGVLPRCLRIFNMNKIAYIVIGGAILESSRDVLVVVMLGDQLELLVALQL